MPYFPPGSSFTLPIGTVLDYGGSTEPTGWRFCYGQNVSRTTYASLFAILSTAFGVGDGSTTFGLPDLRGRATFGRDDMGGAAASRITNAVAGFVGTTLGASGGAQSVTLVAGNIPQLTLTFTSGGSALTNGVLTIAAAGGASIGLDTTGVVGTASPTAVNKVPPAQIMNKIIYAGV